MSAFTRVLAVTPFPSGISRVCGETLEVTKILTLRTGLQTAQGWCV